MQEKIYRCPIKCKWNKKCFVCKVAGEVKGEVTLLHRCVVTKKDIPISIGN